MPTNAITKSQMAPASILVVGANLCMAVGINTDHSCCPHGRLRKILKSKDEPDVCDHRPHSELAKSTPKARCSSTGNLKNYERIVRRAPLRAGEGPLKPPFVLRNAPRIPDDEFPLPTSVKTAQPNTRSFVCVCCLWIGGRITNASITSTGMLARGSRACCINGGLATLGRLGRH